MKIFALTWLVFLKVGKKYYKALFLIELKLFDLLWEKMFWDLWEVGLCDELNTVMWLIKYCDFPCGGFSPDNLTSSNILGYNRR